MTIRPLPSSRAARAPRFHFSSPRRFESLFSAPLDLTTISATSVQVTQVISSGDETPVGGTLLAKGTRITFDPDADLQAGATYHLHLSQLADLGGNQLAPIDLYIKPQATGPTYPQTLGFSPP